MKNMTLMQKYRIYLIMIITSIALTLIGAVLVDKVSLVLWIGIGLLIVSWTWALFFRCPNCGERLSKRFMHAHRPFLDLPKHCPECGESLMDE
ncbi:MAG: hypothetical protein J6K03_02180 [Oscillospiraceae bacterium]|nr:hypothetical protein [Oscillospiraceae bacterium]